MRATTCRRACSTPLSGRRSSVSRWLRPLILPCLIPTRRRPRVATSSSTCWRSPGQQIPEGRPLHRHNRPHLTLRSCRRHLDLAHVYAVSRDGGLPGHRFLRHVSTSLRSPVAAIWLTVVLSIAATLYSPAFAALAAGCAMFLYISYTMTFAAGLLAERKTWTEFVPFGPGDWWVLLITLKDAMTGGSGTVMLSRRGRRSRLLFSFAKYTASAIGHAPR